MRIQFLFLTTPNKINRLRPSPEEKSGLSLDQIEIYDIPKFTHDFEHKHPKIINDHLAEIEGFVQVG